jgi:hypothetical protein
MAIPLKSEMLIAGKAGTGELNMFGEPAAEV